MKTINDFLKFGMRGHFFRRSIILILILLLMPSINYAQFKVFQKVEVYVHYGEGVCNKVRKISLTNDEEDGYYTDSVDPNTDACVLYDVKPGEYLLGFDLGDDIILSKHVYAIKLDPSTFTVYSELYYENEIEVRDNRNLKIHLFISNEVDSQTGFVKRKKFSDDGFDILYYDYFIPNEPSEVEETIDSMDSRMQVNELQRESRAAGGCTSNFRYATQHKTFYEDYSPLFSNADCSYCYSSGTYGKHTLRLNSGDIKYNTTCDKFKIDDVTIYFRKFPDIISNKDMSPGTFGYQAINTIVHKSGAVRVRNCLRSGKKCYCKFNGSFIVNVHSAVYVRDLAGIQNELCNFFNVPCIVANVFKKVKGYPGTTDALHFQKAILDHEKLHCVQYRLLIEGFFRGTLGSQRQRPFYFGKKSESDFLLWKGKTLADKVCESIGDIVCCDSAGACDQSKCNSKINSVRMKAAKKMKSLIKGRLKSTEGSDFLELPAWHFTFLQFNQYKWGGQPQCN